MPRTPGTVGAVEARAIAPRPMVVILSDGQMNDRKGAGMLAPLLPKSHELITVRGYDLARRMSPEPNRNAAFHPISASESSRIKSALGMSTAAHGCPVWAPSRRSCDATRMSASPLNRTSMGRTRRSEKGRERLSCSTPDRPHRAGHARTPNPETGRRSAVQPFGNSA